MERDHRYTATPAHTTAGSNLAATSPSPGKAADRLDRRPSPAAREARGPGESTTMRVLIVEDDAHTSAYIARGLKESGHVVDCATDGRDGLFMATENSYDAMVVDRMLPVLDGLSIIRALRENANSTPVLILSALGEVDDRVQGLRAGGDDYLVKPFAFAELLARLDALTRRAQYGSPRHRLAGRRPGDGPARPNGQARRARSSSCNRASSACSSSDAQSRAGGDAHHAAGGRVGLPLRPADQRHRRARRAVCDRRSTATSRRVSCTRCAVGLRAARGRLRACGSFGRPASAGRLAAAPALPGAGTAVIRLDSPPLLSPPAPGLARQPTRSWRHPRKSNALSPASAACPAVTTAASAGGSHPSKSLLPCTAQSPCEPLASR